jgi:hypothetical protein
VNIPITNAFAAAAYRTPASQAEGEPTYFRAGRLHYAPEAVVDLVAQRDAAFAP